jgi:hypothetical protein
MQRRKISIYRTLGKLKMSMTSRMVDSSSTDLSFDIYTFQNISQNVKAKFSFTRFGKSGKHGLQLLTSNFV